MNALKSFVYLIFAAGLGVGYVPFVLLPRFPRVDTGFLAYLALPLWFVGGLIVLWCFWDFAFKGHGTPLPQDPPKKLVITGPYRHVRNPIYVGVLIIVMGYFLWFGTIWMIGYATLVLLVAHTFVIFYEEKTLKNRFGAAYEDYCRSVPRWIPRLNGARGRMSPPRDKLRVSYYRNDLDPRNGKSSSG